jgi:hypothetical protein
VSASAAPVSPELAISPELALVCPELRREWVAALPERDPDALFRVVRPSLPRVAVRPPDPPVPMLVAAAAYTASSMLVSAVGGALTVALVVAVTLILTLAS